MLRGDLETARQMSLAGIEGTIASINLIGRSLSLSIFGIITCIDGDYDEAKNYCTDGLAVAPRLVHRTYAEWGLALIACAQEDYDEAIRANRFMLSYALDTISIGQMTWGLPAAAMIAAHQGDKEQAVQLMSLAFNHPASTSGWLEQWSLINEFLDDLKTELGIETFDAAWEHGKKLMLEQVIKDWLSSNE